MNQLISKAPVSRKSINLFFFHRFFPVCITGIHPKTEDPHPSALYRLPINKSRGNLVLIFSLLIPFLISCTPERETRIHGYVSEPWIGEEARIEQKPIHYKYAEKIVHPLDIDENGYFSLSLSLSGNEMAIFRLNGDYYPVVLLPGHTLTLYINSQKFPLDVRAEGDDVQWNESYQDYLMATKPVNADIKKEMDAFRSAESNHVLDMYNEKVRLAKDHLTNTHLEPIYYSNIGEYLNRALQSVSYQKSKNPDFNSDLAREKIFEYAREHDFFSLESQKAQRAGIRDFAHNYAMSFNVQDSLRAIYGDQLSDQDVKRLGYDQLNGYREEVVQEIQDEEARAYAEMHLVAKRLGEMPRHISEKSLAGYLETYADYEDYTRFLLNFHEKMTTVEPGQPAVPFTLPDQDGNRVSMSDFDNRYVLLDFWASWCIPCLNEFPDMRRIYQNTSRSQFEIVAISTEEDSLTWRRALQEFDNPWIQLYGGKEFQQETFVSYRGGGIPFYILINPDGEIERYNDIRATHNLERVLDSLLTVKPPE